MFQQYIHMNKSCDRLKCITLFTLWFLKHQPPCMRLGMGHRLRRCAGQCLVGVNTLLRCQWSYPRVVFILLFNRWLGTFWELMSRGGRSVARQSSLTGCAGWIPVWRICVINTRSCHWRKHHTDVSEGKRSVYTGITTASEGHAVRHDNGQDCYTIPLYSGFRGETTAAHFPVRTFSTS